MKEAADKERILKIKYHFFVQYKNERKDIKIS